ncbi:MULTISPECIES: hypothetical protein [Pantoea]|jgi:hypothetical protein|nr:MULTISPECIES: hypothetical protein [Pantoea]MCW1777048.1 hypothetical protein [Pantoea ananatis]UYK95361.1 hypothetical protein NG826_22725 [Pantoea ananatis]
MMQRLPYIATLFMAGIVFNCLRELLEYSVALTHQILVIGAGVCLGLAALVFIVTEIRSRHGDENHEA